MWPNHGYGWKQRYMEGKDMCHHMTVQLSVKRNQCKDSKQYDDDDDDDVWVLLSPLIEG